MKSIISFRVRYQETDQMRVVHHSVYLIWFEAGRTEWLRQKGLSYREFEEKGLLLPVVESGVKYLNPARYDDLVEVETVYLKEPGATFRFEYTVRRLNDAKVLATGFTKHVCIDNSNKIAKEATRSLKNILE
ncbi:MAG: acyl-CoA thioesterase [Bacillota bacterium]